MSKTTKKRNLKTKICAEPPSIPEKNSKVAHQTDISSFFKKQGDEESSSDSLRLPEGALPSPDDAALPCSTTLGTDEIKTHRVEAVEEIRHSEKASCKDVISVPVEKNQNGITVTKKGDGASKKKKTNSTKQNHDIQKSQMTDFFPVRRSNRKPLPKVLKEKHKFIEDAILSGKEDGFEVKDFAGKGRGVVTTKRIMRGEFVLEYSGELIDYEEASRREATYAMKENTGCYMYYFKAQNKRYCVDATKESRRLGRLINHSKKGNLRTQPFYLEDGPHLAFFARQDIAQGEELCYDYGDRSKESLESHPWLAR